MLSLVNIQNMIFKVNSIKLAVNNHSHDGNESLENPLCDDLDIIL